MRWMTWPAMLTVTWILPLAGMAQVASQPASHPASQPTGSAAAGGRPAEREWTEIREFLMTRAPNRLRAAEVYRHLSADDWRDFQQQASRRYQELQQLKGRTPQRYADRLKMLELEDEAFGLGRQLKAATERDMREQVRQQLRETISAILKKGIEEREARINYLSEALITEQRQLTDDRKKHEEIVEHRIDQILKHPWMEPVPSEEREPASRAVPATRPANQP